MTEAQSTTGESRPTDPRARLPRRAQVCYWADLDPVRGREQAGRRPVLVLSHDVFNERSGTAIALAITSQPQRAGYPLTWRIPAGLLPRDSWVKIGRVRTLSTERLGGRVARLATDDLKLIVDGLLELVG